MLTTAIIATATIGSVATLAKTKAAITKGAAKAKAKAYVKKNPVREIPYEMGDFTLSELRDFATAHGVATSGNKATLIKRLSNI